MRLREWQRTLALVYAGMAVTAAVHRADPLAGIAAVVMAVVGYAGSRPLPDLPLPGEGWRLLLVPGLIVMALTIALVAGVTILPIVVGGYCAGNRARAGDLLVCSP